ncbi:MAG: DUF885 domain-containing protein [Candidatus Limnocylindrales bacterium]
MSEMVVGTTQGPAAAALAELADDHWQAHLATHPYSATALGDRRFDRVLGDETPAGVAARLADLAGFRARAAAIDPEALDEDDRLTRLLVFETIDAEVAMLESGIDAWTVDPIQGPHILFMGLPPLQPIVTLVHGRDFIERVHDMARFIDDHIANLRGSLGEGRVAVHQPVVKAINTLDRLASMPLESWSIVDPVHAAHDDWDPDDLSDFRADLLTAVRESLAPAFARFRDVLSDEILPAARSDDEPGIMHLDGGEAAYRRLIKAHTSLDRRPQEIHDIGLAEVARIKVETAALGRRLWGAESYAATVERMHGDRSLYYETREAIVDDARQAMAKARAAIPTWFGILPRAECEVLPIPEHEEAHSVLGYYWQPAADGSRPGQYFINTHLPERRPRYESEALAYHEAIPGHHLQIAIAQELTDLPAFRRHMSVTAYDEGWGLYTERLADEMGIYDSDVDRLGVLAFDAWRACRLVLDTGIHALGWTRQQAIDFMHDNSPVVMENIVNEVDRYITWPGQALAYKTGQLEILRLRAWARDELGDRFDIRAFHDAVLGQGALPLAALGDQVAAYVARASA